MKIAFIGGHLTPALAVYEELLKKDKSLSIVYFGRLNTFSGDKGLSLEYKVFSSFKNVFFVNLISGRFNRHLSLDNILIPFRFMVAFFQSFYWLFVYRPKVIISFGGYLSVPVVFSGFIQSIPIVSHEQTLNLGLSNKINAFFSKKMCVSWPSVLKRIKGDNIVLTGLPLRSAILKPESHEIYSQLKKENLPIVFITGGNQGSHFINNLVKDALAELLVGYVLIHQVGVSEKYHDLQKIEEEIRKLPGILQKRYIIKQHFSPDEIGGIYLVSDIVVGRSGINTVSELLYLKKKAILIPLPFSAAKEQQENAKLLEGAGLAIVLNQYQTSKKTLIETLFKIQSLKINTRVYVEYENLFPKASKKIADEIWQLIK